jgi:DNA-directed RNA polymerase beta' subunit
LVAEGGQGMKGRAREINDKRQEIFKEAKELLLGGSDTQTEVSKILKGYQEEETTEDETMELLIKAFREGISCLI